MERAVIRRKAAPTFGPRQHCGRPVDANDGDAIAGERKGDAAGSGSQFEHPAGIGHRKPPPETDVTSANGLCILPVVERRVLVPPFPAFRHGDGL